MASNMDQELPVETRPGEGYALSGKIMLSAIVILFAVVVFMVGLHLYARWYLLRLRRRQLERRRQRRSARSPIVLYADDHYGSSAVDRGLALEVLNSLPVSLYSSKAAEQPPLECAVCLSEFEENEVVRLLPKCNHSFHIQCIDMWFHSHSTCPLCRSPVEQVVNLTGPSPAAAVVEVAGEVSPSEPCSSSGSGLCATCQREEGSGNENNTTPSGGRRKTGGGNVGLRLEVAPPRRAEIENGLTLSSPGSRLLSLKRLLSMNKKSPFGSGGAPLHEAGTSRGPTELDLEAGLSEPVRVE